MRSGFTPLQAIVMSAVVHAGSAQFAGLSIVAAGGGALPGGAVKRDLQAQAVVVAAAVTALLRAVA